MTQNPNPANRNLRTVAACLGVVVTMTGAAFAAVPLYDLFCRVTGFGGTTQVASAEVARGVPILDRTIRVRFDANVAPGLGWRFEPEVPDVTLRIGEPVTVMYRIRNTGTTASTGVATYNVSPPQVGAYFMKVQCFCFNDMTLQPGESTEAAVLFYVDPELVKDKERGNTREITLSYTFFPSKTQPKPVASAQPQPDARGL